MKHARKDYQDRIVDLWEGVDPDAIPTEEPVFLLRAQDETVPDTVRYWAMRAAKAGAEPRMVQTALLHADAMEVWQREHGRQVPDMPEDA